ncbi:MAG TPA: ABC transporter permease subunit [Alphaproteobacteria bacterium]|nr:ABC transporter permease subunit [Alphaproteobacteria bacterium]
MAVYKRSFKAYNGPLTPAWSRFTVLSRFTFATMFQSRPFTAFAVLCQVPLLIGVAYIYFVHSSTAQALLGLRFGRTPLIGNQWFSVFLYVQGWLGFILTAWSAPGMISKDFANNAVQLYLSRPISRAEYILGKSGALVVLLSAVTWVPTLVLFFLQASMDGHGWLGEHFWMIGAILACSALWIAVITLLAMATSVLAKWRIAATGLMLAIFFVVPGFGEVMNAILRTSWGKLLNLSYLFQVIWAHLFRLQLPDLVNSRLNMVPLWTAWATMLTVCALSLLILNARLKAREVEKR